MRQMLHGQAAGGRRQAAGGPGLCNVPGTAAGDPHAWPWQGARQTLLAQFLQRLAHRCATRVEFLDDHAIVDGGA